ncbi:MAG: serine/threonine-protein kinase, partial [Vulcanimicrobiota bacterium]
MNQSKGLQKGEVGLIASVALLLATLVFVSRVPLDPRAEQPAMEPYHFQLFTDPPGAAIQMRNYLGDSDHTIGHSNDSILTVQSFLEPGEETPEGNWEYSVELVKEGYEKWDATLSSGETSSGYFPPLQKPIIRLVPATLQAHLAYLFTYRTPAAMVIMLSLLGMVVSGFFIHDERRKRQILLRYEADPDSDSYIGKFLHGYFVIGVLGTGGFGKVYKVLDEATLNEKHAKALKIISYERYDTSGIADGAEKEAVEGALTTAKGRFMSEMETLVTSDHPNIYKVYTFGREEGHDWVLMPIYKESLKDILAAQEPPSPDKVLSIARQLADALQYAHDRQIAHRDLKPDNVMFDDRGLKLIDFGVARPKNRETFTAIDSIVGTARYIAPEQVLGSSEVTVDQFAYGLILFELLTGEFPYKLPLGDLMIVNQRLIEEAKKLSEVAPQYGDELEKVLARILDKDPQRRYPDVRQAY